MTDVALATVADLQVLAYDSATSKWKNRTLVIPSNTDRLQDLTDVTMAGVANNKILAWDTATSKAKWVSPVAPVPSTLAALTDVVVGAAQPNDALVYNGAVWGPSHLTYNYTFANMTDGPGSMAGHAGEFMVVDVTESFMTWKTVGQLLAGSDLKLQNLADVDQGLVDTNIGQVPQVYKQSGVYKFKYVSLPTVPSYPVKKDGVNVTAAMTSLNFTGMNVTNATGAVTISPIPLVWQADGIDVSGPPVTKVNFSGTGVGVTDVGGTLQVAIAAAGALSDMSDVDLTMSPSTGQALVYDASAHKWKPGSAGAGKYDIGIFFPGQQVVNNQTILRYVASRNGFKLSDDFANSKGSVGVNPTATTVLTVKRNGTAIGTISISTAGVFTFLTSGTSTENFDGGDVLEVIGAATPNATLADISITFAGVPN